MDIHKTKKGKLRHKRRVPAFRQIEANDCGPTCIQMVTAYYGMKYPLKTIKRHCDMTRLGISLRDVTHCCSALGFEVESVTVNISESHRMPLPAILYFKKGHFVVLERMRQRGDRYVYTIVDPAYGRVVMDEDTLTDKWMSNGWGVAVVMAPDERFGTVEIEPCDKDTTRRLVRTTIKDIYTSHGKSLMWIAFLSLLVVVTNWAMPLLLKTTIDEGIMKKDIGVVWTMLAAQFMFFLGFMITGNISNLISTKMSIRINMKFTARYFAKIINLPMKYFDIGLRSDLMQRLSDLGRIESFVTGNLMSIVFAALNVVVFSLLLLHYNSEVFLIFMVFSIVSFAYNSYFMVRRKYIDYATFSVGSERHNTIYEMIMGMSEIKINNAQQARISAWRKLEEKMNRLTIKSVYLNYYMSNGAGLLGRLRDITLTALCSILVIEGDMTMGTMMMISFLLGQLSGPVSQLIGFSQSVQDANLSYGRINDIYERQEETSPGDVSIAGERVSESISFRNVSFKYAGISSPYVLKDICFDVPVGKITAVVGASGSGKTTLLKLMLGFYYPDEGDILIDGRRMCDVDVNTWRDKCGVVMQDGRVFSGTVAENIAFSVEKADRARLDYAADVAAIKDRIKTLPMGYNTRIGETGVDLSGGEKQRIFIARAVYRDPEFIFFDEATSSLDANTERTIMGNLRSFYNGRTVVIIAHRLSTVKDADNIIFMDKGHIVEQGSHEELLRKKGYYYRLVQNQLEFCDS